MTNHPNRSKHARPVTHWVIWEGPGGELNRTSATSDEDAAQALIAMVRETPILSYGDTFRIVAHD